MRFARELGEDFFLGLEYYADLGPFGAFFSPDNQQHTLFAVTDFKAGRLDVNFGLGYGLTGGSDRLVAKMIIGSALNQPERIRP